MYILDNLKYKNEKGIYLDENKLPSNVKGFENLKKKYLKPYVIDS